MKTLEIITDIAGGFAVGFALGYKGMQNELERDLNVFETILSEDEREEQGMGKKQTELLRKYCKLKRTSFPYAYGFATGALATFTNIPELNMMVNCAIAIPSAYLGSFLGKKLWDYKNRGFGEELKLAEEMKNHPESIEKYLTEKQRKAMDEGIKYIEEQVMGGNVPSALPKDSPMRKIPESLSSPQRAYTPILLSWSLDKVKDVTGTAILGRELRDFYEFVIPLPGFPKELMDKMTHCSSIGDVENMRAKVFRIDGENLETKRYEWENARIIESNRGITTSGERPKISLETRTPWKRDYLSLARKIKETEKDNSILLLKAARDLGEETEAKILTEFFLQRYAETMAKKRAEKDRGAKND